MRTLWCSHESAWQTRPCSREACDGVCAAERGGLGPQHEQSSVEVAAPQHQAHEVRCSALLGPLAWMECVRTRAVGSTNAFIFQAYCMGIVQAHGHGTAQQPWHGRWIDQSTADLVLDRYPTLGVRRGEIITAFAALMHPTKVKCHCRTAQYASQCQLRAIASRPQDSDSIGARRTDQSCIHHCAEISGCAGKGERDCVLKGTDRRDCDQRTLHQVTMRNHGRAPAGHAPHRQRSPR